MSTIRQLVTRHKRKTKKVRCKVPALKKCPQRRGVVQNTFIQTPKKPNSAKRKVAKVKLSTGRTISCYIPGIGHKLSKHSVLLVRGGRAQDLIGVRYKPIHGKFDFAAPAWCITRLSKFGISNKYNKKTKDKALIVTARMKYNAENKILKKAIKIQKTQQNMESRTKRLMKSYIKKRFSSNVRVSISTYLFGR